MSVIVSGFTPRALLRAAIIATAVGVAAVSQVQVASAASAAVSSQSTVINNFTSSDWLNGVWRKAPGVSVPATAANKSALKKGATVTLANGQVRKVTAVYFSGNNMSVMLDGAKLDGNAVGYPKKLVVGSAASAPSAPANTGASKPAAGGGKITLVGVNLAGAEFGHHLGGLPGTFGKEYTYPTEAYFKRYADMKMNLVRLPFRWERLQPKLNTELNGAELARLMQTLDYAKKYNVKVLLDMHNYYRYYEKLIATKEVPIASFADTWRRIAQKVVNHPAVYAYGLMNEPYNTNGQWPQAAAAAAKAIRAIDKNRWIFVAGDRYSSAYHWEAYNPKLISDPWMRDPKNNLVYEAHMYIDHDFSGAYRNTKAVYDPQIGVNRVKPFVEWLKKNKLRGHLGEHGVPDFSPSAIKATDNLLTYLRQNCVSSTYWAGGPWWGEYALSLDVKSGKHRPQLEVMKRQAAASHSCNSIGPTL